MLYHIKEIHSQAELLFDDNFYQERQCDLLLKLQRQYLHITTVDYLREDILLPLLIYLLSPNLPLNVFRLSLSLHQLTLFSRLLTFSIHIRLFVSLGYPVQSSSDIFNPEQTIWPIDPTPFTRDIHTTLPQKYLEP